MAQDNTLARSLHDLGLAAWFGGSLMGAVGLNGAAAVVDAPTQRGVATATVFKAAVTGLALGATAFSRALGERLMRAGDAPVEGGTTPPKRPRRTWPGRSGSSRCSSGSFPG